MDIYSFTAVLRRFTHAVDVVDKHVVDQVCTTMFQYVEDKLNIELFWVVEDGKVSDRPGLQKLWSSTSGAKYAKTIRNDDETYTTQLARAYDSGYPLWVVADNDSPLDTAERYIDQWSGCTNLPAFDPLIDGVTTKTSISVPLKFGVRKLGALRLDSSYKLAITPVAREELLRAAEGIATLISNHQATSDARDATTQAVTELQDVLHSMPSRQLTKPHVFLASSSNADKDVVSAIGEVLERDEFAERITPLPWHDNVQPGAVMEQIVKNLKTAKFGICYLSEPNDAALEPEGDEEADYRDNPNVLFEAGMLKAFRAMDYSGGWVPVREPEPPRAPFDILNENSVIVPRKEDGSLNRAEFEEKLCRRVRVMLGMDEEQSSAR